MIDRRSFLGGLSASLPLIAAPGSLRAQQARPRIHAMLVGINTYTGRGIDGPIKSLRGCLNDADDIERQVQRLQPASFVRLGWDAAARTERPVTREAFLRAWRETLGAAGRGDTVLLTFSGHGSQVPVVPGRPSNEADGLDETLVLTGYSVDQGRNGEHIIDDELDQIFLQAHAKGVVVVFVSDSCHSGTVYRSVDQRVQDTYRFVPIRPAARSTTPAATSAPAEPPPAPPNLLFLGGAQEDEAVPEIRDPGTGLYRGALSMAVARALEGGAISDGVITAYSLASFVLRHVQLVADSGQHADVKWPTLVAERGVNRDTRLFVLAGNSPPTPATPPPPSMGVRLRILGRSAADQRRVAAALRNAALAGDADAAALVWDAERKLVLNDQRHRIAENVEESGLQHTVDRRLALDRLLAMATNGLAVKLLLDGRETPAADATHKPRTVFDIAVSGVEDGHFYCLFNLTGNGQVELLEPNPERASDPNLPPFKVGLRKRRELAGADIPIKGVQVKPQGPFGAEHVVAVAGQFGLERLVPVLLKANERFAIPEVMAALASQLEVQPLRIGYRGIYTGRE